MFATVRKSLPEAARRFGRVSDRDRGGKQRSRKS